MNASGCVIVLAAYESECSSRVLCCLRLYRSNAEEWLCCAVYLHLCLLSPLIQIWKELRLLATGVSLSDTSPILPHSLGLWPLQQISTRPLEDVS
jgi:hypothetical protein